MEQKKKHTGQEAISLEEIKELVRLISGTDVSGIRLSRGSCSLEITRDTASKFVKPRIPEDRFEINLDKPTSISAENETSNKTVEDKDIVIVESPMVGIFYRRPSPDENPFVEVGSSVKAGDTLAIIEAMKVMNQIKSPSDGVIEEIYVENGNMVEFGEALFKIRKA